MIDVHVEPRADNRYDIHAISPDTGDSLVNSSQGYENVEDATGIARKLFGNAAGLRLREIAEILARCDDIAGYDDSEILSMIRNLLDQEFAKPEHVDLIIRHRDGTSRTEPLR